MPVELLDEIAPEIGLVRLSADEIVFEEGEPGDCLYLVSSGSVRISKQGRGGQQETLCVIGAGDFFGEMALLDGRPRSARAAAVETSVLGQISYATFEYILQRAPRRLHANFLRSVTDRLREVNVQYISELMRAERLSLVGTMANSIIHDLKNPIHCIRSCAELVALRQSNAPDSRLVSVINQATDNMLEMIQELLDFARGKSSVQLERRSACSIFHELEGPLMQMVSERVQLIREGTGCLAEVRVDIGRFTRMLLNLIKNSLEAMPDGGLLWLKLREDAGRVFFQVSDTGCGIEPELQSKIFEPFVTFGKSNGTGLGMAIVKSIAEAHGGTVRLTSELGIGTSVEVALPVA
jgi:signal transduction histidine kinase